jgi:hypothetical protein
MDETRVQEQHNDFNSTGGAVFAVPRRLNDSPEDPHKIILSQSKNDVHPTPASGATDIIITVIAVTV